LDEVIRVKEQFYILATSALADDRTRVLKYGKAFAVFDRYGDIQPVGLGEQGIFYQGTRFLSRLVLHLNGKRPLLLNSSVRDDNSALDIDLSNLDSYVDGKVVVPRGTVHIARSKFLYEGACYEKLLVSNYSLTPVDVSLSLVFQADFADIFEVRGTKRERKGRRLPDEVTDSSIVVTYEGLDNVVRRTRISISPTPRRISSDGIEFDGFLEPGAETPFEITVTCEVGEHSPATVMSGYDDAFTGAAEALKNLAAEVCKVSTGNEEFNALLNRSATDLKMMVVGNPEHDYPYAGVPWFSTCFGRDGIITALEILWMDPAVGRGVLAYLAETQATEVNPEMDAEPGKILHEMRKGEMAALGEVPFGRYYGSVDSTPLFVMLAGAYYERTADLTFIQHLWPHIESALEWIRKYGDVDGDGFVEYNRRSENGLVQQGWKDSKDSVFHADGALAEAPIALCEVQGYVYAAKSWASKMALALGRTEQATALALECSDLQERFERAFWLDDLQCYALALDGEKKPCRVRASNAGHCLFTGIAGIGHGRLVARTLMSENMFSGWGVRTLGRGEARFNPMSYHNGSIWPHDNAIVAKGLTSYQLRPLVLRILTGMFEASRFFDLQRMPELFCGFRREPGKGPTLYPVACAPQSWSAAAAFSLLQDCLGLGIDGHARRLILSRPRLPQSIPNLQIKDLRIGDGSVDLELVNLERDVSVNVSRRHGDVEVIAVK
jgi:glycogen debranching enzyme